MSLTLKYDVLRAVIVLQTLSTKPSVTAVVEALGLPQTIVIPMIWRQTRDNWDNGRPWLSASLYKQVYYVSYTNYGWTVYETWKTKSVITESQEKTWIDNVRSGSRPARRSEDGINIVETDVTNAAIPSGQRHGETHESLDYFIMISKQLGCRLSDLYEGLASGEFRICTAPGCESGIKKADDFYNKFSKCKECGKRGKNENQIV